MAPRLQAAGIPMITPVSTSPDVTLEGDYIFRACYTDAFQGKVMAQFAYADIKARKAAIVKCFDQKYSMILADIFDQSFKTLGGQVLFEDGYKSKAVDFKEIVENER